jgi:fermentation-respiration switch protein FrsA (DUF1100 family)
MTVISAITLANASFGQENKKTFKLSDKVTVEKVSYKNRYGTNVAADMYLPKNMDRSKTHPALIIGTPYGGVKE